MPRSDLRFAIVILVMLLVGGGLRLRETSLAASQPRAEQVAVGTALATPGASGPAAGAQAAAPEDFRLEGMYVPIDTPIGLPPAGAEDAVKNFYTLVDKGRYDEVYPIAAEVRWQKVADKTYKAGGLTSRDEFVAALKGELVYDGFVIHLVSLQTLDVQPLTPDMQNPLTRRELWATASLPAGVQVDGLYQVPVRGRVMTSCTAYDFFRRVTVAHLKGDGGWIVLLPGPLDPNGNHYEEWFKNTAR